MSLTRFRRPVKSPGWCVQASALFFEGRYCDLQSLHVLVASVADGDAEGVEQSGEDCDGNGEKKVRLGRLTQGARREASAGLSGKTVVKPSATGSTNKRR